MRDAKRAMLDLVEELRTLVEEREWDDEFPTQSEEIARQETCINRLRGEIFKAHKAAREAAVEVGEAMAAKLNFMMLERDHFKAEAQRLEQERDNAVAYRYSETA